MFGPDDPSAVSARPAPAAAGAMGWYSSGNPAAGVLPTLVQADTLNGIVAELLSLLTAAGITPSKTAVNQVLQSIQKITTAALAGGAYTGVNAWSTTQTLTAAQVCGYLNLAVNGPTLTLPPPSSVAAGTPIDFIAVGAAATLQVPSNCYVNSGDTAVATWKLQKADKVHLVSDGTSTWYVAMEGNLYNPTYRQSVTTPSVSAPPATDLLLQSGGVTLLKAGADGFAHAPGTSPPRPASDDRVARLDWVRALGRRFNNEYYVTGSFTMLAAGVGGVYSLGGSGTAALPKSADPLLTSGDTATLLNLGTGTWSVTVQSGDTLNGPGVFSNSISLGPGMAAEIYTNAQGYWNIARYGSIQSSSKLSLINSVSNPNTSAVTFTWTAAQWQEVEVEFDGAGTNQSASFSVNYSIQRADGTWSPSAGIVSTGSTAATTRVSGSIRLLDPTRNSGQGLGAFAVNPGDPQVAVIQGAANAGVFAAIHAGGAIGIRISTDSAPFAVGNFNFLGR